MIEVGLGQQSLRIHTYLWEEEVMELQFLATM